MDGLHRSIQKPMRRVLPVQRQCYLFPIEKIRYVKIPLLIYNKLSASRWIKVPLSPARRACSKCSARRCTSGRSFVSKASAPGVKTPARAEFLPPFSRPSPICLCKMEPTDSTRPDVGISIGRAFCQRPAKINGQHIRIGAQIGNGRLQQVVFQSLYGSNSSALAMHTPIGFSTCKTSMVSAWASRTVCSLR